MQKHGVLALNTGGHMGPSDLDRWLYRFNGTLIQLFNTCHAASSNALPSNASLPADKDDDGSWGRQGQPTEPPRASRCISFFSCCPDATQTPEYATAVLDAFVAAFT